MQRRHSLTRKVEEEESEEVAKPTLGRSGSGSKMASRSDRIVASLQALSDERLQRLTTRIGADELAVALLDADPQIKARIAGCLQGESADMFNQYLSMGKEKLPSSVIDEVQGKLLRLAMMS